MENYSSIIMMVVVIAVLFIFMILPENKRKKKAQEMRASLKVGDDITTIGGFVGTIVEVNDDFITFETSEDRVRVQVAKWAVSTVGKSAIQK